MAGLSPVTVELLGAIARVSLNAPPVNAAGQALRQALWDAAAAIEADTKIKAVILVGKGRGFCAGADISEFGRPAQAPLLAELLGKIAAAHTPWLAALHGMALGGGLELALACHARIATPDCQLGLPEVSLGLIPGAGGTFRLPRVIGVAQAVEMICYGKPITGKQAAEIGLVDALADDLPTNALALAQDIATRGLTAVTGATGLRVAPEPPDWGALTATLRRKTRGQSAPLVALETIQTSLGLPEHKALAQERAAFIALRDGAESAALRHLFRAERAAMRPKQLGTAQPRATSNTGVIGGGTMGSGIATALLMAGYPVTLIERDESAATKGAALVRHNLDAAQSRGLIPDTAALLNTFQTSTDYAALAPCDLVIEAVFEDFDIKRAVFTALEAHCAPEAILASNTSYLDLNALAATLAQPARLLGLHFFAPAHIMKLLEVVETNATAPETLATGFALARALGKVAVRAGVCDGFIGNRIMSAYRRECEYILADGASPADIDAAMRGFGFPMGVFEMQDLSGLEISYAMRKRQAATRNSAQRYIPIADWLVEAGRLGRKTKGGWYAYPDGKTPEPAPDTAALIARYRREAGIVPRRFEETAIMGRILAAMQGEGRAILTEGIANSADDIDVVMVNGYGFPRWRGGPMWMLANPTP
ncbi:3-hydroxyacyl-CoA dehydrogenase NAD-binding domain-containing protein [Abyssibius alkaniclasticus]|uniref:3-hydroxyacyl-CoA dehydrogenase NAD-binding domain-containing protein n=1 Tax=Abyssibius alkaniclasticus TaxID=2881234 RepID=UPI002363F3CA|nr:3-hydroxyacyl-CoA dehydrogenase NAD-binding domain-containing protein [Abyssibius alkaniclasticus]UPH70438.1 3-hydroxyacyl-CoA dehydrogenase NAD-binding domain-containing protein [Abyssibius alkaniclasticus]